jgi:hypothetical protein
VICALEVDGGDYAVAPGGDGEFDEVRAEAVKAIGLERTSGASRYVDGRRLEKLSCAGVLRGNDEELDLLRNKIGERVREVRWVEARRVEVRREAAAYRRRRIRAECSQMLWTPVTNRGGLAALIGEGRRGKWRGGLGTFIGVGRGRITQGVTEN